jgi:hypothetical protein
MEGAVTPGCYNHPQLGLIKILKKDGQWVYICYTHNGGKTFSRPKPVDPWLWALSQKNEEMVDTDNL